MDHINQARAVLQPTDIGLVLSYRCSNACKHCVYNCGPNWKDWISEADAANALGLIKTAFPDAQVHITGGEPFLNFPLLHSTVQFAAQLEIPVYVETNAAWAGDANTVKSRFEQLHDAGLQAVLISCSPFHAESIPLRRTLMAIDQAITTFGIEHVFVFLAEWIDQIWRFGDRTPVALQHYVDSYGFEPAGLLFWDGYSLISGGRAGYALGAYTERLPAKEFQYLHCMEELLYATHSHFDCYGNYITGFCSGISLGQWKELPAMRVAYQNRQYPELINMLLDGGPFALFKFARGHGYQSLIKGYAGKCHLCTDVRKFLVNSHGYAELTPRQFYAMI